MGIPVTVISGWYDNGVFVSELKLLTWYIMMRYAALVWAIIIAHYLLILNSPQSTSPLCQFLSLKADFP